MSTEVNKAVQQRIIDEIINGKKLNLADELFAAAHELHPMTPEVATGPDGMKRAFPALHEEFPDVRARIESMVAEGDMVAVRLTFIGTQRSTNRRATWPEMVFTRFLNGQAVDSWELIDTGRSWDSSPW